MISTKTDHHRDLQETLVIVLGLILIVLGLLLASLKFLLWIGIILLIIGLIVNFIPIGGSRRRVW